MFLASWWLHGGPSDAPRTSRTPPAAAGRPTTAGDDTPAEDTAAVDASLSGHVTRAADGAPLGATVTAKRHLHGEIDEPAIVVATDATGGWQLAVAPGTWTITATADGFVPAVGDAVVDSEGHASTDLALAAGGVALTGTVVDVSGGPIAGARIALRPEPRVTLEPEPSDVELSATTDAAGAYRIAVAPGRYYAIAEHDDYAAKFQLVEAHDAAVRADFALAAGGTIRGVVVARDTGAPIANAVVRTVGASLGERMGLAVATAADGTFTMRGVERGATDLGVRARGYASGATTTVRLGLGERVDGVVLVADRAFAIRGRVTGRDGHSIPGMRVTATQHVQAWPVIRLSAVGDWRGEFAIEGVLPGAYWVECGGFHDGTGMTVEVVDHDANDTTLALRDDAGATVRGRIEPPIAGVRVELSTQEDVRTDERGAFAFAHVEHGPHAVRAFASDGRAGIASFVIGESDASDVVIPLAAASALSGTVVDGDGRPVAGATVRVDTAGAGDRPGTYDRTREATTRADGSFELQPLLPGAYRVWAHDSRPEKLESFDPEIASVELAAGASSSVQLRIPSRPLALRGKVVDEHGAPVADASVVARPNDYPPYAVDTPPVLTAADGSFTLPHLHAGSYVVVAESPRGDLRGQVSDVGADEVTIALAPTPAIAGRVTRDGAPVSGYEIRCGDEHVFAMHQRVSAPDGAFAFEYLVPGRYTCDVATIAGATGRGTVEVASGRAQLDIAIVGVIVTGTIVDAFSHQPLAGVQVSALTSAGGLAQPRTPAVSTDGAGRFELHDAPPETTLKVFGARGDTLGSRSYRTDGTAIDVGTVAVATPPHDPRFGYIGVNIREDFALHVWKGGVADRAGMVTTDHLVSINGVPVAGLPPDTVEAELDTSPAPGDVIVLGVQRGDRALTFTLVAELPSP